MKLQSSVGFHLERSSDSAFEKDPAVCLKPTLTLKAIPLSSVELDEEGWTESSTYDVSTSCLSATGIINAGVQTNRETQGDKWAGVPAS